MRSFRHAGAADGNPIAGRINWTIGYGISQSGRTSKTFILLGFNEDEDGRILWDGADSNIAGAMGQFNIRFAQPGNIANIFEPAPKRRCGGRITTTGARARRERNPRSLPSDPDLPEDLRGLRRTGSLVWTRWRRHRRHRGSEDIPVPRKRSAGITTRAHRTVAAPEAFRSRSPALAGLMLARIRNPETETRRALLLNLIDW